LEITQGTYCALASDAATDYVITDGLSNIRAVMFKLSNVNPLITGCLPILTEACGMLQISDLALMTSGNSTEFNE
jgi:hypothetical protein